MSYKREVAESIIMSATRKMDRAKKVLRQKYHKNFSPDEREVHRLAGRFIGTSAATGALVGGTLAAIHGVPGAAPRLALKSAIRSAGLATAVGGAASALTRYDELKKRKLVQSKKQGLPGGVKEDVTEQAWDFLEYLCEAHGLSDTEQAHFDRAAKKSRHVRAMAFDQENIYNQAHKRAHFWGRVKRKLRLSRKTDAEINAHAEKKASRHVRNWAREALKSDDSRHYEMKTGKKAPEDKTSDYAKGPVARAAGQALKKHLQHSDAAKATSETLKRLHKVSSTKMSEKSGRRTSI